MQRQISWPAAAVLCVFIVAWVVCLALKLEVPTWMSALGSVVGAVILALLQPLIGGGAPAQAKVPPMNAVEREAAKLGQRGAASLRLLGSLALAAVALVVLVACLSLTGCLASAPIVPVTAENQPQVDSCQKIAGTYNGLVVGDWAIGGAGAVAGGVGVFVPAGTGKDVLAGSAAGAAALAAAGAGLAAYAGNDFANSHCSDVVGALPPPPAPAVKPAAGAADAGGQ